MPRTIRAGERIANSAGSEPAPGVAYAETVALPRVDLDDPVGQVVVDVLFSAGARMAACNEDARRGESAGIHRLRTTVRRLRSDLRSLEDLVDRPWRQDLCGELKWLAGQLGEVRDLDILGARLEQGIEARKSGHASEAELTALMTALHNRRAQAARALADVLRSDRYGSLVMNIELSAAQPPLSSAAAVPCREALPEIATASWRRIRRAGRALKKSDPDEQLHEFRKRVKRARYIAELIAPILGRRALRSGWTLRPAAHPDSRHAGRASRRRHRRDRDRTHARAPLPTIARCTNRPPHCWNFSVKMPTHRALASSRSGNNSTARNRAAG